MIWMMTTRMKEKRMFRFEFCGIAFLHFRVLRKLQIVCYSLGAFHMMVRIRTFNVIRSFIFSFEIPSKTLISF